MTKINDLHSSIFCKPADKSMTKFTLVVTRNFSVDCATHFKCKNSTGKQNKTKKTGGVDQSERSTYRFSISLNEALTEDAASWSSDIIPDLIEREFLCKNIPNAEKSKHLLFSFDTLSKTLLA